MLSDFVPLYHSVEPHGGYQKTRHNTALFLHGSVTVLGHSHFPLLALSS